MLFRQELSNSQQTMCEWTSVEVAKLWKIFTNGDFYTHSCLLLNTWLVWLNNVLLSIRVMLPNSVECRSYAMNKQQIVLSQDRSFFVSRQKVSVLSEIVNIFHIWRLLHWCWVLRTNNRCVESQHQCRSRQMWKISQIHLEHSHPLLRKNVV